MLAIFRDGGRKEQYGCIIFTGVGSGMASGPRVGFGEAVALTVIFLVSKLLLSHLALIFPLGLSASWMLPLIHLPAGLIGFALLAWLLNQFPGRTIIEIGEEVVGPVVNTVFALAYYFFFVFGSSLAVRQFSEFVLTGFYPETPISVAALFFMASAALVAYLGLETLARVARILFYFLGFGLVFLLLLTTELWSLHGIMPLWGPGVPDLLWGAFCTLGVGSEVFLLALVAPFLPRGRLLAIGFVSIVVAAAVMAVVMLVFLLVFAYPIVREPVLPIFELTRAVQLGKFLMRMEVFFLPLWVFSSLVALSAALYAATAIAARTFRLPYYRPFILPTVVLILAGAFYPPNFPMAIKLGFIFFAQWSFIPLGLMVITLVVATLMRKRRRSPST